MEDVINFLKSIKPTDGVVIVFHSDVDGICSCAMIKRWLGTVGAEPYVISQPMPPDANLLRRIQTGLPNKIIVLDIAIDQQPVLVKKLRGIADVLIIDHHVINQDMSSQGIVHHNPRFKNPKIYQSCSYLTYKILGRMMDASELLWLAMLGAVADYDLTWSEDLVNEAEKRYDKSIFGKVAAMVESVRVTKAIPSEKIVDVMANSKGPEQILEAGDFRKAHDTIEAEIEAAMQGAEASAEHVGDIIFYNIKPRYNVKSPVSTKLSEKRPDKLVVVFEKGGKKVDASFRSHTKKFNCNRLARQAALKIKGASAGGHEAAAGATIPEAEWERFKMRLIEAAQKG